MNRIESKSLIALAWLALAVAMTGCSSSPFTGTPTASGPETGIGREVGSILGSQVGGQNAYLGSMVGQTAGSIVEKSATGPQAAVTPR